jgi:hypothetical protein
MDYEVFIRYPEKIEDGQELGMILRNPKTFEHIPALVKVYKSFKKNPDKDRLTILTPLGLVQGEPWSIQLIKKLKEESLFDSKLHLAAEFKGGV